MRLWLPSFSYLCKLWKKERIITSFSDVITNSSTEVFLIQGPDALRQMIGTGIYKISKDFLVLKTEEDVEYFFRFQGKKGFNHNYSIWDLKPLLGNLFNLYLDMNNEFLIKKMIFGKCLNQRLWRD